MLALNLYHRILVLSPVSLIHCSIHPPAATLLRELRYACGQCQREVRRDAKHCPHCSAALGDRA